MLSTSRRMHAFDYVAGVPEGEISICPGCRVAHPSCPRADQSSTSAVRGCPEAAVLHSADTALQARPRDLAAHFARVLSNVRPSKNRGRGECRMPDAPEAPCAKCSKHTVVDHRFTGFTRHSRTLLVLTGYAVLSSATNSSCRRHRRIEDFAEPGWIRKTSADLTPATGARTTRFCRPRAACAKVFSGLGTHPLKFGRRRFQHRSSARRLGLTDLATCPARALRARRRRVHRIPSQRS